MTSLRLVVDTNILVSALLRDSTVRKILLTTPIEFMVPDMVLEELEEHIGEISTRNGKTVLANKRIVNILVRNLRVIRTEDLEGSMDDAICIMKDIDPDDAYCLAAAMSIHCDGIWTQDAHFDGQSMIKVWRTKDLLHYLK